jgi:uncharacterized protein
MVAELVPIPAHPADLFRVNRFFRFEEDQKRLLFCVESTAFLELDRASWMLADLIAGKERVRRSEILRDLEAEVPEAEASAAVVAFEQLHLLEPVARPKFSPELQPVKMSPLASLVLHVAHDCNLRCSYCYADFGRYGSDPGIMTAEMAIEHAKRFFDQLGPTEKVGVTFFGGEPLMNMPVVYAAHAYMKARAASEGRRITFGLTTNGTLLTNELVDFFAREHFTITISIDGPPDVHDRLRPLQEGGGSYQRIMERVKATGIHAIARVTLTKRSTDVARIVRHLVAAGFKEVGMSPVSTGNEKFDLGPPELEKLRVGMRALADDFVEWAKQGRIFPFSNVKGLLEQIAAGEPRHAPCGAGTRLVAADNKGDLYACHRLVGEADFKIGDLERGVDAKKRLALLEDFHPRTRAPCGACWARYLCGGGCHHIAWLHSKKGEAPWMIGDAFCDFLRDWYRIGLYTYARLADEAPEMLKHLKGERPACGQASGL